MRTSKVSRDAAKLFDHVSESLPSHRVTRSALSRFAHNAPKSEREAIPDIEDALSPPSKRRKTTVIKRGRDAIKSELVEDALIALDKSPKPKRTRKPARKTTDASTGETSVAPPSDWEETYDLVRKMRSPGGVAWGAAVDTMGCERLADEKSSPRDQRYHTLVALMLSSQTKDTVNAVAMRRLKSEIPAHTEGAPKGLNVENMLAVDPELLNQLIWAVGFHNNKTKYLKQTAIVLRDEWDSDIPDTIEGLMSLPGVGPKMAYLCLSAAWDKTEGIGVDVHVHRITNLWGWQTSKTPEETRLALQAWLPKDRWREINHMLVGLGQTICLPIGRKCGECDLGLQGLCRSAERKKVIAGRKIQEEKTEIKNEDGELAKVEVVKEEVKIKEEIVNEEVPV